MKKLLGKYKLVIRFIFLFIGTYILLTICYSWYLHFSKNGSFPPDYITYLVAKQSSSVLHTFHYDAQIIPDTSQSAVKLIFEGVYLAKIIEGCNAVNIIILFIAFIVAFAQRIKKTFLFILAGTTLIYTINVIRIAVLCVAIYKFPDYEKILHHVVFPGMIYGVVFLLWMLWVRMLKNNP